MKTLKHYILFPSHTSGLELEKLLKKEKIKYTIVPTPRELSACCGISMEYNKENEYSIKKLIDDNNISILGFHSLEKEYKRFY